MRTSVVACFAIAVVACGGSESSESPPAGHASAGGTSGALGPAAAPAEDDPLSDPDEEGGAAGALGAEGADTGGDGAGEATPSGPGRLTVGILVGRDEATGKVRVLQAGGDVVEEGRAGQTFTLPAGDYVLEAEISDESVLVDTPQSRSDIIRLAPGEERTENVTFGRSQVRLKVMRGQRRIRKGRITLRRAGSDEEVLQMKIGDDYVSISSGRYDATVRFGNNEVEVSGIVFQPGAKQDIPIRVQ